MSRCIKATLAGAQSQTAPCIHTQWWVCVEKSPQAAITGQIISTASAHPYRATPTTSSTNHIPPIAAFLGVLSHRAEVHLCTQRLGKAKAVSEKCSHRRAEKFPLCNGITSSKLLTR